MTEIYGYNQREAIRVKVKKCEPNIPPEWRKFSVDPQITSLEVLYSILGKAFDIKSDFTICYKTLDQTGQEAYLSVLSDWDLDAAFLKAHNISIQTGTEPCLSLRVDIKSFSEANDWEVNSSQISKEISASLQQSFGVGQKYVQNMQNKLPGLIMNQMEKTFSMVQRALNFTDDQILSQPPRQPLCDSEFRSFLDSVGQILQPKELRKVIFIGGIDPSLRKVVWKHILNVYPSGMTGRERMDYMKRKATEYYRLREVWRLAIQKGPVVGELAYVTSMVRKDVLRTDRLHPFYAGSDDNQNIASLFNILTTYALNHPSVSYCQGMSDIASPLLVTMGDEAHAYICFCAIMNRLKVNFMLDGIAMTQKFTHLSEALQFYDPEFFNYLKIQQADDLLFCYRWLLLEMKREFAFDDSLRMLEVLWSSLNYEPPTNELNLYEKEFEPPPIDVPSPKSPSVVLRTPRENHYTKVCALRRQSSSASLLSSSPNSSINGSLNFTHASHESIVMIGDAKLNVTKRLNHSLDENIARRRLARAKTVKAHQSLDETKMIMLMENMKMLHEEDDLNKSMSSMIESTTEELEQEQSVKSPLIASDIERNEEVTRIVFHPTNPFIEDANLEQQQQGVDQIDSVQTTKQMRIEDFIESKVEKNAASPKRDSSKLIYSKQIQRNNLHNKNAQNKNLFSTGNITKQIASKKGGHFKELKEKIAASKKGILASFDKIENQFDVPTSAAAATATITQSFDLSSNKSNSNNHNVSKGQKVVKNLNEFLNFASINKSRISDKLVTTLTFDISDEDLKEIETTTTNHRPLIKLTKNSFDDSDSSTFENTITAETASQNQKNINNANSNNNQSAIQNQQQNLDSNSPDDSQDYYPMTTSITRELRLDLENLDRQVFGNSTRIFEKSHKLSEEETEIVYEKLDKDSLDMIEIRGEEIIECPNLNEIIEMRNQHEKRNLIDPLKRISTCSTGTDVFIWENPLHQMSGASSCNFNEIINDDETAIINNDIISKKRSEFSTNQAVTITPDEQQDLEYDGDIILECNAGENSNKSVTSVKLISSNATATTKRLLTNHTVNSRSSDESDSDNTDSWKNSIINNPFLSQPAKNVTIATTAASIEKPISKQENYFESKNNSRILDVFTEQQHQQLNTENGTFNEEIVDKTNTTNNPTNINSNINSLETKFKYVLPPPNEFGGGNPFLMFLCLTLLLQHRNYVMKNAMDYNEMAMHFDKMVRKHDVNRVLNQARRMYFEYLKTQHNFRLSIERSTSSSPPITTTTLTETATTTIAFNSGINFNNIKS